MSSGRSHDEIAALAAIRQVGRYSAFRIGFDIGLRDRVTALVHRRQIDDLVCHPAVDHAPVRAFDKPVLIDAGISRQAVDQADIGALRGLDRADPAVMGRVHVTHLEAGALAGQPAGTEGRQAPLVGDLRQRVRLVHELRQLRRAEELAHRRRRRFCIDQVVRHDGVDLDRAHALADRPLHAQQSNAVLVFHQLADRADPAVAEMIDIVDLAAAVLQIDQNLEDRQDVRFAKSAHRIVRREAEPRVHFDTADRRQIIALRVEEQAVEQRLGRFQGRRLARAHHAVDVDQRVLTGRILVDRKRAADVGTDADVIDVEHRQLLDAAGGQLCKRRAGDLVAGLEINLASLFIDQIRSEITADQLLIRNEHIGQSALAQSPRDARRHPLARRQRDFTGAGIEQIARQLAFETLFPECRHPSLIAAPEGYRPVEVGEDLLLGHANGFARLQHPVLGAAGRPQSLGGGIVEGEQQGCRWKLAAPVDPHIDMIFGVELEIEPRAAIRDYPRCKQVFSRRMRFALVVVEEDPRAAVHLGDDHALGAVDDESAVLRHQGHVAHVDVLLFYVTDRPRPGVLVDIPHDQA